MSVFANQASNDYGTESSGSGVGEDSKQIDGITFESIEQRRGRRVRSVDWAKILEICDKAAIEEPGKWGLVGVFDRSVRSHIANGRYSYIDPKKYEVTTRKVDDPNAPKNRGYLYMRRRVENPQEN